MMNRSSVIKKIAVIMISVCMILAAWPMVSVRAASGVAYNPIYRLYNPNSGEHFYTLNSAEKDNLINVGWRYEGIGWNAPKSGNPVYRIYNRNAGDHHYTLSEKERDNLIKEGWEYEGIAWYSSVEKSVPLYRVYNPNCKGAGSHHYTVSKNEINNLITAGWRDEGIAWYGVYSESDPDTCDHEWATGTVEEFVPQVEWDIDSPLIYKNSEYRGYDECNNCGRLYDKVADVRRCPCGNEMGSCGPTQKVIAETYPNDSWAGHGWATGNYPTYKKWKVTKDASKRTVTYKYCTKCGKGTYHPAEWDKKKVVDTKSFEYICSPSFERQNELTFWCPFCGNKYTQTEVDQMIEAQRKAHPGEGVIESNVECKFSPRGDGCNAEHLCWKYLEVKKTFPEKSHTVWTIKKAAYYEGGKVE